MSPNRREILDLLAGREATGSDLARELGRWQPNVSRDLTALYRAGLLTRRPTSDKRRVFYTRAGDR